MSDLREALGDLARLGADGARVGDEPAGKALLACLGIAIPPGRIVDDVDTATTTAKSLGWPVAVKRVACDLPHKSDVAAVAGPLGSSAEVRAVAARMLGTGDRVLVERWVEGAVDCFIGLALHTPLGPVVSFGLGGVWVEAMRDVAHRLAPVSEVEALEMIRSLRGAPLLFGGRGHPPVNVDALATTIARVSSLAADPFAREVLDELDVNPVAVRHGLPPVALDATAFLRPIAGAADGTLGAGRVSGADGVPRDLAALLEPSSIAVIGASASPEKPGHLLLRNIVDGGFAGSIYPINPRGGEIAGLRAYPSVGEAPGQIDLAFIVLGRPHVLPAVEACAAMGVRAVCIITAGFGEGDAWGVEEQRRIAAVVAAHDMIAIGPNTIGTISMGGALLGSFVPFERWHDGPVAIVAQTGIYAGAVALDLMSRDTQRLGITASVDIGNRVGIDELALLEELDRREEVGVLGFYLEEFADAPRFLARAADVKRRKPIVVLKPGRTREGARASASHTGSLAQDDDVIDQLLAQHGVLRAADSEDFLSILKALSCAPEGAGPRVGVVTYSGALGVMATDRLVLAGLSLAELAPATIEAIDRLMPDWQSASNPADLWSAVEVDPRASVEVGFGAMLADPEVDQVLGVLLAVPGADFDGFGDAFASLRTDHPDKPVHLVLHGALSAHWRREVDELGLPVYDSVAVAVSAIAALAGREATRLKTPAVHVEDGSTLA